jgi:hypothetical protein
LVAALRAQRAWQHLPGGDLERAVAEGLGALRLRGMVTLDNGILAIAPDQDQGVAFYAASALQRLDATQGIAPPEATELTSPAEPTRGET